MADEIGFLQRMELGQPNGVAPLDENRMLKKDVVPLLTPKEIGAESKGAALIAFAAHKAELNPHPNYALSTDPRFTDSRTPKTHTHPSSEIVFSSPAWTNLTLLNLWTNRIGTTAQYRKYASGIVEVKFWLTKLTPPLLGESLFSLPALHRPKEDYQFSAVMNDSKKAYILGHLNVGADGNVGFFSNKLDVNTEVRSRLIFGID